MAIESIYADAFIAHVLKADATLTGASALNGQHVHKNRAPQGAVYPCDVYDLYDVDDSVTGSGERLFARFVYRNRVVGAVVGTELQDAARFRLAANRADQLLGKIERVAHTVEGVTFNFNVWRLSELPPPREVQGATPDVFHRYAGGLYRVEVFS